MKITLSLLLASLAVSTSHAFSLNDLKDFFSDPGLSCEVGTFSYPTDLFERGYTTAEILSDDRTKALNETEVITEFNEVSERRMVAQTEQLGEVYSFHIVSDELGLRSLNALLKVEDSIRRRISKNLFESAGRYVSGQILRPELDDLIFNEDDMVATIFKCSL